MQNDFLSTIEVAQILQVKPNTLRHALCEKGHYCGMKPIKLPNRKLLWRKSDLLNLIEVGVSKEVTK